MLIDNLHRINSPSDLFKYICELEENMEKDNELLKQTASKYLSARKTLQVFMTHDGWVPVDEKTPTSARYLEVYITAPEAIDEANGMFEMAHYYPEEGYRLCEACKDWTVRYWRYLGESDSNG